MAACSRSLQGLIHRRDPQRGARGGPCILEMLAVTASLAEGPGRGRRAPPDGRFSEPPTAEGLVTCAVGREGGAIGIVSIRREDHPRRGASPARRRLSERGDRGEAGVNTAPRNAVSRASRSTLYASAGLDCVAGAITANGSRPGQRPVGWISNQFWVDPGLRPDASALQNPSAAQGFCAGFGYLRLIANSHGSRPRNHGPVGLERIPRAARHPRRRRRGHYVAAGCFGDRDHRGRRRRP